jgi:hypothetical protein
MENPFVTQLDSTPGDAKHKPHQKEQDQPMPSGQGDLDEGLMQFAHKSMKSRQIQHDQECGEQHRHGHKAGGNQYFVSHIRLLEKPDEEHDETGA